MNTKRASPRAVSVCVPADPRDVERILERITSLRARQGRAAARRLVSAEGDIAVAARRIAADGRSPTDALNDALQSTAEHTHGAVRGWWVDAAKLEELELPAEILQAPTLNVAVAVSHYRRADEPWTRYVVVLVVATPQQTLASRDRWTRSHFHSTPGSLHSLRRRMP